MRIGAAQFVRAGAFLAGLAAAAMAVSGWRVPTQSAPGASLRAVAVGTSELVASPNHPFLVSRGLKPGSRHAVSREVTLTNTMAQNLAVRIHALPSIPDLDHVLRLSATADGKLVYRGTLSRMRSWTRRQFVVPMRAQTGLRLRFWLPASMRSGYQNRAATITLEFKLARAGSGG